MPNSNKLFQKLNQTIGDQALSNPQDVSLSFIVRYLSTFFDLPNSRNLTKDENAKWVQLLESKIKEQKYQTAMASNLEALAKILIRNKHSQVLSEYVASTLKSQARQLDYN